VTASPLYNNNGELIGSIECIREISEQKEAENQLKTTLAEKEALLRELYHRTKNNMQMISSMLSLQADLINDQQVVNVFKDMENRIRSMALSTNGLYQSRNLSASIWLST
jgi:two-component sensor histidine kinase